MGLLVLENDKLGRAGVQQLREAAYQLLSLIPPGKVVSYGDIAKALGVSPRLIGRFMRENENPIIIPCHRVVGSDGRLVGYSLGSGGVGLKRKILELEGVKFCGKKVCRESFYDLLGALGL
ncbi:MAG: MGMT family protein [Desulfurococcales archaeon]|nr:MGMT family protein [Desulfurococcales archaeon]